MSYKTVLTWKKSGHYLLSYVHLYFFMAAILETVRDKENMKADLKSQTPNYFLKSSVLLQIFWAT